MAAPDFNSNSIATPLPALDFSLPPELEASEPPEARGIARDQVRLLVTHYLDDRLMHVSFRDLPAFLDSGDVLVLNTSGTMNAALRAARQDGTPLELHLSTHLDDDLWSVEVRSIQAEGTKLFNELTREESLYLPDHATVTLHAPYINDCSGTEVESDRLWTGTLHLPCPVDDYLLQFGFPIRYNYVKESWPLPYYQTVYATEAGSAEMPSAGRPFTRELMERLVRRGVQFAPLILHTGVASVESHEPPYKEYFQVPAETAHLVNTARQAGKRIVAVGTTAVRALETVTNADGVAHSSQGWTCLVITPRRGLRVVNAMLTGFHEAEASHLAILEALAALPHLQMAYREALRQGYLWHEFGDLHLILP